MTEPASNHSIATPTAPTDASAAGTAPARRRRWRRLLGIPFGLLLLLGGVALGGRWWLERWAARPFGRAGERTITIRPGTPTRQIARDLARQGLVSDDRVLLAWLGLSRNLGRIQAGEFRVAGPITPADLIATFHHGAFERRLTIPEGWTARQIAARLKTQGWIADEREWLDLVAGPLPESILGESIPRGAEGFCFPETYRVEQGAGAEAILRLMLGEFARQWRAARPDERTSASRALSLDQVVILASMIEREARLPDEMPRIASVYLNRLARGMRLQCCATVYYSLGGGPAWDRPLTRTDLKVASPFNTYLHPGLPPGPIANPGRPAIEAVLRPERTDYLFYVYRGDGRHLFSRTYKEHQAAVREARRGNPQAEIVQQRPD